MSDIDALRAALDFLRTRLVGTPPNVDMEDYLALASESPREGLRALSRYDLTVLGDMLVTAHGESCDCNICLVVQPLVDAALGDTGGTK